MFISNIFRKIFKPTQRGRIWMIVLGIVVLAFFAGNLDYPNYWNKGANWLNPKLEAYNLPDSVKKYDKWGVFLRIDSVARMPKFNKGFSLGLDLQGGIHLVYEANLSDISHGDEDEAMASLRDAIERRVNFLGVSEPIVQIEKGTGSPRLIIELAGIQDPDEAVRQIGQTPFLEFKEFRLKEEQIPIVQQAFNFEGSEGASAINAETFCDNPHSTAIQFVMISTGQDPCFKSTGLTGQFLERSNVVSHPQTGEIQIALQFNEEGSKLFEEVTERNVGSVVAIYLDGSPISLPVVNQKITGGQAVISGSGEGAFSLEGGRELSRNLNAGALPVPIQLISQQRIGAALGEKSIEDSLKAGVIAIVAVLIFLIVVYRFSGILAVISLAVYLIFIIALIKLIPITLTLAGIAGLILSIGMAVDANILIFERLREELSDMDNVAMAVDKAFVRAWTSIRDGNISTLLTAVILFWFTTSFVKGFALTLGLGIIVSLFSSMIITKYLMKLFLGTKLERIKLIWTR